MELFLVRHAPAEEAAPRQKDPTRRLTSDGRARFTRAVKGLRALDVRFDKLCHSPWLRATETADLLSPLLHGEAETLVLTALAAAPTEALLANLQGERVAVVGHEPWLSELASLLLVGDASLAPKLPLKKGGLLWLEGEAKAGGMTLRAALPPKVLRSLG